MIKNTYESKSENMKKLLLEHEVMWEELQEVYNDFWTARDKFYKYLTSNNFMKESDFHIYKMMLFEQTKGYAN